jgi:carbamoyl-phosphate synthase large subunit
MHEEKHPNVVDLIREKTVGMVINISDMTDIKETELVGEHVSDGYLIRRASVDANIPLITNILSAIRTITALKRYEKTGFTVKAWSEYK